MKRMEILLRNSWHVSLFQRSYYLPIVIALQATKCPILCLVITLNTMSAFASNNLSVAVARLNRD